MPSSSRYFSTVRRAMVSARPFRMSATSWSESGLEGSSFARRSWIIFFTDTDEWKGEVLRQGREVLFQAADGLAS